jgi:tripeptide aminopeptidase
MTDESAKFAGFINEERLVRTFTDLLQVNSPSFGERELGDLLRARLEEAGCTVRFQDYGESFNLMALRKGRDGGRPVLMLSGHMDTIEPTEGIVFSNRDGMIMTTGKTVLGADDKSALAQIIEALTVLGERDVPHGDIEIVFSSAEEKALVGAKNLDFPLIRSRHALVLDSSGNVGSLVTAAPSQITYEMRVTGSPAHAGIEPEKGLSSIRVAADIICRIPDGRIDPRTTANVGVIEGGTATNMVPYETVIRGEMRSHDLPALMELRRSLFETAESVAAEKGAKLVISEQEEYSAFTIGEDDPFLKFLDGVYRQCGMEPAHVTSGGGSDANVFNRQGIKAVVVSNGMMDVHSTNERISIEDLRKGCLVALTAVAEFGKFVEGEKKGQRQGRR